MLRILLFVSLLVASLSCEAAEEDTVLYRFRNETLRTSKYGPIAALQNALEQGLQACTPPRPHVSSDGSFGQGTSTAIKTFARCHHFSQPLPQNSAARTGAITTLLWKELLPTSAAPSAEQRANDLTLVFEATDYTALEFNYCQSRSPKSGKTWLEGDKQCYSNDPCSFATWGPRGATVGGGQEIQRILWQINKQDAGVVSSAFGSEYDAATRLLSADKESGEVLLCAAFVDPNRRAAWRAAFNRLGQLQEVRKAYDEVYLSRAADGSKMLNFYEIYKNLKPFIGRDPTEIDYALFLDRATHGGSPTANQVHELTEQLKQFINSRSNPPTPAELRWKLTALLPVGNQKQDRLGRDVVYVYDDLGGALGVEALNAWKHRGPFRASDFGLSDERFVASFVATPANAYGEQPRHDAATAAERSACPTVVLRPRKPATGKVRQCSDR